MTIYDTIGVGYTLNRRPDPRWEAVIHRALGEATTILNVGAGAGSYEPHDRNVVALEPSSRMIAQRSNATPIVQGVAGALPFPDASFDAALAVLTVHHWPDAPAGLAEMQRVARRQVIVTWEPARFEQFWLVRDYLSNEPPEAVFAGSQIANQLHNVDTIPLPVPHDCTDGFFGAYWRRPQAYLDPAARASISGLALRPPEAVHAAMSRLEADIRSGAWRRKHAGLLHLDELDLGYRVLVGKGG